MRSSVHPQHGQYGVNTMASMPRTCDYCGMSHARRCPSVQAIEYYPDGAVKRVEFVKIEPIRLDYSEVKVGPAGKPRDVP